MEWLQIFLVCFAATTMTNCSETAQQRSCNTRSLSKGCRMTHQPPVIWCDSSNWTTIPRPNDIKVERVPISKSDGLYLNHSCVDRVDKNRLSMYTRLKTLSLADDFITELEVGVFNRTGTLRYLILTKNKLTKVTRVFQGLNVLIDLYLDKNHIGKIEENSFDDLRKLEVLKLNDNNLTHIPLNLFQNLIALKRLDLSGNQLVQFYPDHLSGLGNLWLLNLSNNALKTFDLHDMFLGGSGIKSLYLNNNSISCFPQNPHNRQFHDLSVFQISGNPLRTPNETWFANIVCNTRDPVDEVLISKSGSWVCDCKSYAYSHFIALKSKKWQKILDIECHEPASLRGKMLGSLSWSDISSKNNCFEPDEKETCPHEEHEKLGEDEIFTSHFLSPQSTTKSPSHITAAHSLLVATFKAPPSPGTSAAHQQSNWVAVVIATVSLIVILLLIVGSSFRRKMFRKWIEKESDRNHENASRSAHSSEDYSFDDNSSVRSSRHDPVPEQFAMEPYPRLPTRTPGPGQSWTDLDNPNEVDHALTTRVIDATETSIPEETGLLDETPPKEIGTSERTRSHDDIENDYESIRTRQSEDRNQENNRTQTQQRQPPLMFCVSQPNYMSFLPPLGQQQQIVGLQYAFPPQVASPFLATGPNFVCPTTAVSTPSSHPSVIPGYINYNPS